MGDAKSNFQWEASKLLRQISCGTDPHEKNLDTISTELRVRRKNVLDFQKIKLCVCTKCNTPWKEGRFSMRVRSIKVPKKMKKLIHSSSDGISSYKKKLIKSYNSKQDNVMVLRCLVCHNFTKYNMTKQKMGITRDILTSTKHQNDLKIPPKKKKKKKKDVLAGLKIDNITTKVKKKKSSLDLESKENEFKKNEGNTINSIPEDLKFQGVDTENNITKQKVGIPIDSGTIMKQQNDSKNRMKRKIAIAGLKIEVSKEIKNKVLGTECKENKSKESESTPVSKDLKCQKLDRNVDVEPRLNEDCPDENSVILNKHPKEMITTEITRSYLELKNNFNKLRDVGGNSNNPLSLIRNENTVHLSTVKTSEDFQCGQSGSSKKTNTIKAKKCKQSELNSVKKKKKKRAISVTKNVKNFNHVKSELKDFINSL